MQQSSLNIRTPLQNGVRSIECRVQGWFRTEHKTDQVSGVRGEEGTLKSVIPLDRYEKEKERESARKQLSRTVTSLFRTHDHDLVDTNIICNTDLL